MKPLLLTLLLLPMILASQVIDKTLLRLENTKRPNFWAKEIASDALAFNAGLFFRRAEIRKDDFRRYQNKHPKADPQWANPVYSFKNKYENYPVDLSPAFPLSTTLLVGLTDGFHSDNSIAGISLAACIGLSMSLYEKPNFKTILWKSVRTWAFYGMGRAAANSLYPKP